MTSTTKSLYTGHRFPPELISYTVWLYFRFPLSLRLVGEMLAFRGIEVSHETIRQWGLKFGQAFARHCHGNSGAPSAVTIICLDAADLVCPPPVPARRHPACGVALSPLHTELPRR